MYTVGFEPTTRGTSTRCYYQTELRVHYVLVVLRGIEPLTLANQASTFPSTPQDQFWWGGVVTLHPRLKTSFTDSLRKLSALPPRILVHPTGFEPASSALKVQRPRPFRPRVHSWWEFILSEALPHVVYGHISFKPASFP